MDNNQLLYKLTKYRGDKIVIVGDKDGWSNVEDVVLDGSQIKIVMSDNVVFSDDKSKEEPRG